MAISNGVEIAPFPLSHNEEFDHSINERNNVRWLNASDTCERDVMIKKMAVAILFLMNISALGYTFYYISCCYSIASEALVVTPFITGILAALMLLKLPTCGVTGDNYKNLTNPVLILGHIIATCLFFPVVLLKNYLDFNNYSDPYVVHKVRRDLLEQPFSFVLENYSGKIANLGKYGLLQEELVEEFTNLCITYSQTVENYRLLLNEYPEIEETELLPSDLKNDLEQAEEEWQKFKLKLALPDPSLPSPTFSWWQRTSYSFGKLFPDDEEVAKAT